MYSVQVKENDMWKEVSPQKYLGPAYDRALAANMFFGYHTRVLDKDGKQLVEWPNV